jgi:hypothetical protein
VRITHPFHPRYEQQLICIGKRHCRYGTRLLLRIDEDNICTVPPQWTDAVDSSLDVTLGQGRVAFRLDDLLELAGFLDRLLDTRNQR